MSIVGSGSNYSHHSHASVPIRPDQFLVTSLAPLLTTAETMASLPDARDSVLHNVDIIDAIFQVFKSEGNPSESRSTLARAGRVCQLFSDIALPLVWNRLNDLLPLWYILLPGDAPVVIESTPSGYAKRNELIDQVSTRSLLSMKSQADGL